MPPEEPMSDWQTRYADKVIDPSAAIDLIEDGSLVHLGAVASDPWYLMPYLHERREGKHDVVAYGDLTRLDLQWDDNLAEERHVEMRSAYLTPGPRSAYQAGRTHYHPATVFTEPRRYERDLGDPDIGIYHMSPPDERGYMSFGFAMWDNKITLRRSRTVIAEVAPNVVRTAGDNYVHVDEVDYLVPIPDDAMPNVTPRVPDRDEGQLARLDLAGAFAAELVRDGDTVEIGVGAASNAVTSHLASKRDLGYHSELTGPGIATLFAQGVFNGSRKSRDVGKMVVTALPGVPEELAIAQQHFDDWLVFGVDYIHDPAVIASQSNMTSINTGTMIDLTGQFVFDSMGRDMYTGPGGQLEFVIGAVYAPGGRSIHVLPATAGETSRIVCELPPGANVGIPRYLTDLVVTEFGVASLFGKTERDRARELIAIADPDHRADLTKQARAAHLL
jgi:4-hydroxybutyrate CoA-transferase